MLLMIISYPQGDPLINGRSLYGYCIGNAYSAYWQRQSYVYANVAATHKWVMQTIKKNSMWYETEGLYWHE